MKLTASVLVPSIVRSSLRSLVLAVFVGAFFALPARPALAVGFTVDTTSDASLTACTGAAADCSLRGAITNADASGPADTIFFDAAIFPSGAPATVAIGSTLPALTGGNDTVDASGRGVIVQGAEARSFSCLVVSTPGNAVKGLQLTDCSSAIFLNATTSDGNTIGPGNTITDSNSGVRIAAGASDNVIIGNKIGTNPAGTAIAAEGANGTGIQILGPNNTVGGGSPADRNIVSGNSTGVQLVGTGATGNVVRGNFVGTDLTGTVDLGGSNGVFLNGLASGNTIGGLAPGQGNLISGNDNVNFSISDVGTSNNAVIGNIIGPDINGSGTAMINGTGLFIQAGASNNTIGPRNVISDSFDSGVRIGGSGSQGNVVKGNFIGTNLTGSAGVANGADGILIDTSASSNAIGGATPGDGNIVAFNTGDGIEVNGAGSTGNAIRGNSLNTNGGLEINDAVGGNLELLAPVIFSTIGATATGTACASCLVDIFSDTSVDARFYEGSVTAAADGSFTFRNEAPFIGPNVTATNTDGSGNTSELAATVVVDSDGDGTADGSDSDDDNDGIADTSDACRVFPEDFDGFQDADGCPEPDNDLDGICDSGLTSVSCAGSDVGKSAFFPAGHVHGDPADADCRNVPEDRDAFKDTDGCPEPDNDNDGFPDPTDECPGTADQTGADGALGPPQDSNHNGIQDGGEAAFVIDDVIQTFEDYDGILDTDGCHDSPCDDFDGDSFGRTRDGCPLFSDEREAALGTNPGRACAADSTPDNESPDPQPEDFNDDGSVTGADLSAIAGVIGQTVPPAPVRRDLNLDGAIAGADLSLVAGRIGLVCVPPGPAG